MSIEDFMLPCLNKTLFGFECMGCGIQRSAFMVIRGEFVGAFYMYPAIYSLILLFAFVIINHFKNFKFGGTIIIALAILNVILIVGNYFFKTLNF